MKTKNLLVMLAAFAGAGIAQAADRVVLSDLPAPVQRSIDATGNRAAVKEVNKKTVDGQVVYDVEFEKNNAINPRLRIAADGTVLKGDATTANSALDPHVRTAAGATADAAARVSGAANDLGTRASNAMNTYENVPASVLEAVQRHAAGREIADIDQETWNGQTVYEVEFREAGTNPQIHVAADGTLLKAEKEKRGVGAIFRGTQLEDTPNAVQATIKRELGSNQINDIDKEVRTGRAVYEVEFKDSTGTRQIHVAEDGSVVKDDRTK